MGNRTVLRQRFARPGQDYSRDRLRRVHQPTARGGRGALTHPMIGEGHIHGGLAIGFAPAIMEEISYDELGNIHGSNFMDYLLPTAVETLKWELGETATPSPTHPTGRRVG